MQRSQSCNVIAKLKIQIIHCFSNFAGRNKQIVVLATHSSTIDGAGGYSSHKTKEINRESKTDRN